MADAAKLTGWLAGSVCEAERLPELVRDELLVRCRAERVEPPTAGRSTGSSAQHRTDPAGAGFRLWQVRRRLGAQVANTPGAWNFSDLYTPDRDTALAFYTAVFCWRAMDLGQERAR